MEKSNAKGTSFELQAPVPSVLNQIHTEKNEGNKIEFLFWCISRTVIF
jgi:hypothetical protein